MLAPLDWGLGHTTRCLPLLRHLRNADIQVVFAGSAFQRAFVQSQVPDLECLPLAGYGVSYARTRRGFFPKLAAQLPAIRQAIRYEHRWLAALASERSFDGIISDNRYGLWHSRIPSVILTHQLRVQTGLGGWADAAFQRLHYRLLERFDQCWVVDGETAPGLSGSLAHPSRLPSNARYLGVLPQAEAPMDSDGDKRHVLILLSGPEPQRTILADRLWMQALKLGQRVVFVEGSRSAPVRSGNGQVVWHAIRSWDDLQPLLIQASYVVCRSGYSTLMDAAALGAKLLLIPTPGQPEQEYLGRFWHEQGYAPCHRQEAFNLEQALAAAAVFPYRAVPEETTKHTFKTVLRPWLDGL